jgi:hypothetical protein
MGKDGNFKKGGWKDEAAEEQSRETKNSQAFNLIQ